MIVKPTRPAPIADQVSIRKPPPLEPLLLSPVGEALPLLVPLVPLELLVAEDDEDELPAVEDAVEELPLAPVEAVVNKPLSSPRESVSVIGIYDMSVGPRVVLVAVEVIEVSNEASVLVNDGASVAIKPAGPTNVSAQAAAVVPDTVQSSTTEVLSNDSSA